MSTPWTSSLSNSLNGLQCVDHSHLGLKLGSRWTEVWHEIYVYDGRLLTYFPL